MAGGTCMSSLRSTLDHESTSLPSGQTWSSSPTQIRWKLTCRRSSRGTSGSIVQSSV
eukprot:CAMPEP_0119350224 /NCGR_PEP_ID=MMETSP1333-20130426/109950_1 /TAXON_ID=418940 /ORGANISM="Scyphosphaera apsteinii, Strain RCC1455" /LENGTH=56 /DNA_ID=CAMNT_0007362837 /DNA_START=630 /DNA_END=800 /DNA_ORIENTATION=-